MSFLTGLTGFTGIEFNHEFTRMHTNTQKCLKTFLVTDSLVFQFYPRIIVRPYLFSTPFLMVFSYRS